MKLQKFARDHWAIILVAVCFLISPILSLPVTFCVFLKERSKGKQLACAAFISLAMAYLAFHIVPLESDDLSRHYWSMGVLQEIPFKDIFTASYPGVYLNTLIMYLIGKTGYNGLYPALFVGVGYFLILHNAIRLKIHDHGFLHGALMILFVLFCVNCRDFISGLRNYFTFIICGYLFVSYKHFGLNKWVCFGLMALMGLIHTSVYIIMAVFLVSELVTGKKLKRLFLVAECLFLPAAILGCKVLLMIPALSQSVFVNKIYTYFTTPNIINFNVYLFELGILVLAVLCHLINKRFPDEEYEKMENFFDYFLMFIVAVCPIMLLLFRMEFLLIPLMPIILMRTYRILQEGLLLPKIAWIHKHRLAEKCFSFGLMLFVAAGVLMFAASLRAYPWSFDVNNIFFRFL